MDFADELVAFGQRIAKVVDRLQTEEAVKHSLILPFLQMVGYNIFDPSEVIPEFTADVGLKKGEKVDYAILVGGSPAILIEAKGPSEDLSRHTAQLYRYFSVTPARFAILTNGIQYRFFFDLQEANKLDDQPFLEVDLANLNEAAVAELKKFHRDSFDAESLFSAANDLKYTTRIKQAFDSELKEPTDDFQRFWLGDLYSGRLTQSVLDEFRPIVKRALSQYINDLINDRLKSAIQKADGDGSSRTDQEGAAETTVVERTIETTAEELEAFFIVKSILRQAVDA